MLKLALLLLALSSSSSACTYGLSAAYTAGPPDRYTCYSHIHPDEATCFRDYGPPRHCHIWAGRWVCR